MTKVLSEEPTFEEALVHLHKVFNVETYRLLFFARLINVKKWLIEKGRIVRKIIVGIIALLLVGCARSDPHSNAARISRSELVKTCKDGTWIGFDPQDKVYVALRQSDWFLGGRTWWATIGPNVNQESVCS